MIRHKLATFGRLSCMRAAAARLVKFERLRGNKSRRQAVLYFNMERSEALKGLKQITVDIY